MRPDQFERLKTLSETLTDVVIDEADPQSWPGAGQDLAMLTREDRGDRYWCKRNAAASLSIIMKIQNLVGVIEARAPRKPGELPDDGSDLDAEVKAAERAAAEILKKMQNRTRAKPI